MGPSGGRYHHVPYGGLFTAPKVKPSRITMVMISMMDGTGRMMDIEQAQRRVRMQMLIMQCPVLTRTELKELLLLRFDADDSISLKRFLLRVHPDKVRNGVGFENCDLWVSAVNCGLAALRATQPDVEDALCRLKAALQPLSDVETPPLPSETEDEADSHDEYDDYAPRDYMPTMCVFCHKTAQVSEVLSAVKYNTTEVATRRLANHEWQHAECAKKNRMSKRVRVVGGRGLEGTERCTLRNCFVDSITRAEIRVKKSSKRR